IGTWQWGSSAWGWNRGYRKNDVLEAFDKALELGIDFFDTAEVYGGGRSESLLGEALKGRRDDVFIATKILPWRVTDHAVERAAERSRRRLGIDVIDLYQLHFPSPMVPIGRVVRAMERLVRKGVVRYLGVSNVGVRGLRKAREALASEEIASDQVQYSLLRRKPERSLLSYAQREGITLIAYSPLAQGLLTGKYAVDSVPRDLIRGVNPLFAPGNLRRASPALDLLSSLASERGKTSAQFALNWLLNSGSVIPIPGAKRASHVEEAASAAGWSMAEAEWKEIDEAFQAIRTSRWRALPWMVGRSIRASIRRSKKTSD
ncbi:MAG: aldo/keto reductase, partial [Thermoplasmata archaeon]